MYQGVLEADMNLDIAFRLQHMLKAVASRWSMTRTQYLAVNTPQLDLNGDGKLNGTDELVARNDIANLARADLHVVLMNNAYGCHCEHGTETYTNGGGAGRRKAWTWRGSSRPHTCAAEGLLPCGQVEANDRRREAWEFAAIRPYNEYQMPRPDLMPSILVESLFMDHANELAVSQRRMRAPPWLSRLLRRHRPLAGQARLRVALRHDVDHPLGRGGAARRLRLASHQSRERDQFRLGAGGTHGLTAPGRPYTGPRCAARSWQKHPSRTGSRPAVMDVAMNAVPMPTIGGNWLVKFDVRLPGGKHAVRPWRGRTAGAVDHHGVGPPPTPRPEPSDTPGAQPVNPSRRVLHRPHRRLTCQPRSPRCR